MPHGHSDASEWRGTEMMPRGAASPAAMATRLDGDSQPSFDDCVGKATDRETLAWFWRRAELVGSACLRARWDEMSSSNCIRRDGLISRLKTYLYKYFTCT